MNKVQYIKLLELRGVTELKGETIADAVERTGGKPSDREMVIVNHQAMLHYINEFTEEKDKNEKLSKKVEALEVKADWLYCLEAAGVDNWEGYDIAIDIRDREG